MTKLISLKKFKFHMFCVTNLTNFIAFVILCGFATPGENRRISVRAWEALPPRGHYCGPRV
jgi:hypothetical protein